MNDTPPATATDDNSRCGYVAIVGRPNVGKSTLLNHILGQKLSITSRKPQTTRHRILGIKTEGPVQVVYVDTPGIHRTEGRAINRAMNRAASSTLSDVDLVLFVVEKLQWTDEDELVLQQLKNARCPVILVVNKVDQLRDKERLLPYLEEVHKKFSFAEVFPVSALRGTNQAELERAIARYLPVSVHFFPEDQITDRSQRFLAAEIVREKIMRQLGEEVPYQVAVEVEEFKLEGRCWHISMVIYVEKDGQKAIVIGEGGSRLKRIGQDARLDIQRMLDNKVMLRLWVKVKGGWSDDERALRSLGYQEY